jgi:phosphoglycolate phosphatase
MKTIALLIFDLDGTLVNTLEDITASVNFTLAQLGKSPLETNTVRRYVGDGIDKLITRSLGGLPERLNEAVIIYREHHRRNLVNGSKLYPSVKETLEYYKELPMAVITNKNMEFCLPLLDQLGIGHYFKMVIGADYGLALKPAPDAVLKILEEYKVPKERAVLVGDGTTDIEAGKAAGVITCAVTYGFRPEEELSGIKPDFMIREFSELKKHFIALR